MVTDLRAFLSLIRWDLVTELRRRDAVLNMCLFALLILFIGSYAISTRNELQPVFGPIYFWVAILFAGTIGLSRAFLIEKENGVMPSILVTPVDPGVFYFAKVVATWIYVFGMSLLVLGVYGVLFQFEEAASFPSLIAVMATFTLVYVAIGTVISGMTADLRGGELILRVLIFPFMIPSIIVALGATEGTFMPRNPGSASLPPYLCVVALLAIAVIFLASGFLLFAKVVEE